MYQSYVWIIGALKNSEVYITINVNWMDGTNILLKQCVMSVILRKRLRDVRMFLDFFKLYIL